MQHWAYLYIYIYPALYMLDLESTTALGLPDWEKYPLGWIFFQIWYLTRDLWKARRSPLGLLHKTPTMQSTIVAHSQEIIQSPGRLDPSTVPFLARLPWSSQLWNISNSEREQYIPERLRVSLFSLVENY